MKKIKKDRQTPLNPNKCDSEKKNIVGHFSYIVRNCKKKSPLQLPPPLRHDCYTPKPRHSGRYHYVDCYQYLEPCSHLYFLPSFNFISSQEQIHPLNYHADRDLFGLRTLMLSATKRGEIKDSTLNIDATIAILKQEPPERQFINQLTTMYQNTTP